MKWILMFSMFIVFFHPIWNPQKEENYQPITAENLELLEEISVLEFEVDDNINSINQMAFHPSNSTLYSLEFNETIRVWDMNSLEFLEVLDLPTEYATSFMISPEGDSILYGGWDFTQQSDFATLNFWDITQETNDVIHREGNDNIEQIAFSSSGDQFAVAGWDDYSIRIWNVETNEMVATLYGHSDVVTQIAIVDDLYLVSSGQDGLVNVWDLASLELLESFDGYFFILNSPNSALLVLSGSNTESNHTLVDLSTLEISSTYEIEGTPFAFNQRGDVIAVIGVLGEIWLHDFESGERIIHVGANNGNFPPPIAFSPDEKYLALQSGLGNVAIWAVPSQESE